MIAHIRGLLFKKTPESVIIQVGGIGYEVLVPLSTFYSLPDEDREVDLYIYTHVREDALVLFGFSTPLEKDLLLMLISVSGIGPKLAVNILSGMGPEELLDAVVSGDSARLQSIPGVGRKTSERIVLELKDRAARFVRPREGTRTATVRRDQEGVEDAVSALVNLGYPAKSARKAVEKAHSTVKDGDLEGLIREALRILS